MFRVLKLVCRNLISEGVAINGLIGKHAILSEYFNICSISCSRCRVVFFDFLSLRKYRETCCADSPYYACLFTFISKNVPFEIIDVMNL